MWLWTLALAEEKDIFSSCHILLNNCLYFPMLACLFSLLPALHELLSNMWLTFKKMPSQHIFHDISENCCSLNFSIFVCFSLIKLIKPLGPHFRNVSNSPICGIFFQQNETITTFRALLWRGVVSVPHPAVFPLAVSMSVCPSRPETASFFLSSSKNSILPFYDNLS